MEDRVRNGKLVQKLIFAAVAAIVGIATVLTIISGIEINKTYTDMVKEELNVAATQLNSEMTYVWDGEWEYIDGTVLKGGEDVMAEYEGIMDDLKAETGMEYSLFYGKKCVITSMKDKSGQKAVGYELTDDVFNAVVGSKSEAYIPKTVPAGATEKYYCYYLPVYQDDGTVIGAAFAGRASADVSKNVSAIITAMVVIAIILTIALSTVGILVANTASVKMRAIAGELEHLSKGQLELDINPNYIKRNDEIGMLADGAKKLSEKLGQVIKTTMDMSDEMKKSGSELSDSASLASEASSQVSEAVNGISRGAVSQAESVETAAGSTQDIGNDIDIVVENVEQLNGFTDVMKTSCTAAMEALEKLIEHSNEVQSSVRDIGNTIESTNESAKEITKFSEAITEIASETNLLSLNASIEAARAGEAGKGFSVVATQIGQLAVQSSNSAEEIKKIVEKLVADSEASVEVMQRLNASFEQQSEQLDNTKTNMKSMAENVDNVSGSTGNIAGHIDQLNSAKEKLVEVISDLSAISQENAASSQETNASMEELNETFSVISQSAQNLQKLAGDLSEAISYFKA